MAFQGFPEAGLNFLTELGQNNNKEWFEAHKETYIAHVQKPAVAFVIALGEKLRSIAPDVQVDTRANGAGSLMRIHRDTRFSADKTPYKTAVAMMFWEGAGKKMESPAFGYHFEPHTGQSMAGIFAFPKHWLAAYREAVADEKLGAELAEAVDTVQRLDGYTVGTQTFKRVPQGYPADHPRADLLRYDGLHATGPEIDRVTLMSPELVDVCFELARNMAPIQRWLLKLSERINSARD
ncbi:MAG: DUF2461 domain-containing protein [Anaerolineae bacterium]